MDLLIRGLQDLRSTLQQPGGFPARQRQHDATGACVRRRTRLVPAALSPPAAAILAQPFPEAWKTYCCSNPRLRDPRTLPTLLRRGVPDELRADVWCHCLGIDVGDGLGTSLSSGGSSGNSSPSPAATPMLIATPREVSIEAQEITSVAEHAESCLQPPTAAEFEMSETPSEAPSELDRVPESISEPEDAPKMRHTSCGSKAHESSQDTVPKRLVLAVDGAALPRTITDLIEADVARTFPSCEAFRAAGGPDRLRRVLRRLAASDTELGYCQSLNFIAAVFITVLNDEHAALEAVRRLLVKLGTRAWYTEGMRQLRADTAVLEDLVRERLPVVHKVFRSYKFDLLFISSKWFLCLFATALERDALRLVWDVMLCDGIEAVFRVAFAMVVQHSKAILNARSIDDLIHMFQEQQPKTITPEVLIQTAYSQELVGTISRAELSQRRREAAKRITSDDTRLEMRNTHLRRGGVRPASLEEASVRAQCAALER